MNRMTGAAVCGGVSLVLGVAVWQAAPSRGGEEPKPGAPAAADDQPEGREDLPLRDYMRQKLEASNQVLEGLCTDDAKMVQDGATKLKEMSQSERWRVSNDAMYRQFSGDFREITEQLLDAAEKENMDRAALKWMDATMSCIECHRYVRGTMIADEGTSVRAQE